MSYWECEFEGKAYRISIEAAENAVRLTCDPEPPLDLEMELRRMLQASVDIMVEHLEQDTLFEVL